MFVTTVIVSILLAVALMMSAAGKLSKSASIVESMGRVGVTPERFPVLAALEIAGAVGVLAGLAWWPIGVAAAAGIILYFLGAVTTHVRSRDVAGSVPALFLGAVAAAALILRLLTT